MGPDYYGIMGGLGSQNPRRTPKRYRAVRTPLPVYVPLCLLESNQACLALVTSAVFSLVCIMLVYVSLFFFLFFFIRFIIIALLFLSPSRNSDPRSHMHEQALSSAPSRLRFVPCIFIARRLKPFLAPSTRVESNGVYLKQNVVVRKRALLVRVTGSNIHGNKKFGTLLLNEV